MWRRGNKVVISAPLTILDEKSEEKRAGFVFEFGAVSLIIVFTSLDVKSYMFYIKISGPCWIRDQRSSTPADKCLHTRVHNSRRYLISSFLRFDFGC